MDNIYLAALQTVPGVGNARLKSLVTAFGCAEKAWKAPRRDLFLSGCLDVTVCNNLIEQREKIDIHKIAESWNRQGIKLCSLFDDNYPDRLRTIFDPPVLLYYRGNLPDKQPMLAIVGSRRSTAYGKNAASFLAAELAAAGIGIVSGAARGIDSAAHQGALSKGYTVAVLGSGPDVIYPPENAKMLAAVAEQGAVISEYAPGTRPHPGHFPQRNRIISGLASGVLVIEAAAKSGALITADLALEAGREVYAVPGSIFSATSSGTNYLIKQGAKLVDCPADILEDYGISPSTGKTDVSAKLTGEEAMLVEALPYEAPLTVEELVAKTDLPTQVATYILLQLELKGLVARHSGHRYVRVAGRELFE